MRIGVVSSSRRGVLGLVAVVATIALVVSSTALATAARAAGGSDVGVTLWDVWQESWAGEDTLVEGYFDVQGEDDPGSPVLTFTATNATIQSAKFNNVAEPCTVNGSAVATCVVPEAFTAGDGSAGLAILVRPTVAGNVTVELSVASAVADPNAGNNSSSTQFTAGSARVATLTAAASHTNTADRARLSGRLLAAGAGAAYEALTIWSRPTGSLSGYVSVDSYVSTDASGRWDTEIALGPAKSYDLEVRHAASSQAAAATAKTTLAARAAVVRISVSSRSPMYGRTMTINGTVRFPDGSAHYGGELMRLQRRSNSSAAWTTIASQVPSNGTVTRRLTATGSAQYRWLFAGAGISLGPAATAPVGIVVTKYVVAVVSPTRVTPGSTVTIALTVRPAKGSIGIQRKSGSSWSKVTSASVPKSGKRVFTIKVRKSGAFTYRATSGAIGTVAARSTPGVTVTSTRRGLGNAKAYRFLYTASGVPARWNPCQVIDYRVNLKYAKPGALADTKEALRRITQANGLRFRYRGATSFIPLSGRGRQSTDLVVAWAPPRLTGYQIGGYVLARGGPTTQLSNRPEHIAGRVVIDSTAKLPAGFGRGATRGLVLMHELGHVVGLSHVNSKHQIMQPGGGMANAVFGAGDIAGLKKLGRSQGCL